MKSKSATLPHRRFARAIVLRFILAVTTVACGGGGDPPTGSGGNGGGGGGGGGGNNNPGPPASISIESGDAQSAEPRFAVANPVVILVRDSINRAVPSAVVSVAVDSGGGNISTATATTGSDGRATLGTWTLGATEGPQVLRISAGTVSNKARATARIPQTTIAPQTAPANGGTITVTQAGSSINGLTLTIPASSYTAPKSVAISYASSSQLTAPVAGAKVISPLLTIAGLETRASKDMLLTIPVALAAGQTPAVLIKNPASNVVSPLRLISWNATSVTVSFQSLNGAALDDRLSEAAAPPSALRSAGKSAIRARGAMLDPAGPAQVYTISIPDADVFKDHLTNFLTTRDGWHFPAIPTVLDPFTQRGMAASALHYFNRHKNFGGLATSLLFGDQVTNYVPFANWRSIRLVSMASLTDAVFQYGTINPQQQSSDAAYRSIAVAMLLSNSPVPVWIVKKDQSEVRTVLVAQISQGGMNVYDPLDGNAAPGRLLFDANHILAGYVSSKSGTTLTDVDVVPATVYNFYDNAVLTNLINSSGSPTFGDDKFPRAVVRSQFDSLTRGLDSVYVVDTLSMWSECSACTGKGVPATFSPNPAPANGEVLPSWFWASAVSGGPLTSITGDRAADLRGGFRLNQNLPRVSKLAFINTGNCGSGTQTYLCWIDARSANMIRTLARVDAPPDTVKPGSVANFTATVPLVPTGTEREWDYDDGSPREKKGTANAASHTFSKAGTYWVRLRAYHPRTKQLIAFDSAKVIVDGCADSFVDARDNTTYQQVCIGSQTWMAENLKFNAPGSLCYAYLATNCVTYGRWYTHAQALAGATGSITNPSNVRGICPTGWHVPSNAEWIMLLDRFGGAAVASAALRSVTNFTTNVIPGTNSSKMNVLAAGRGSITSAQPQWLQQGLIAFFFTSDPRTFNTAGGLYLSGAEAIVRVGGVFAEDFHNLRCVKD